jgi:hypothetical protein
MKDQRGMLSFRIGIKKIECAPSELDEFFKGEWNVSHNYDFYVLYGGEWDEGECYTDRTAITCIIRHGYKFYSGVAVYKPGDRKDNAKGQQVAFGRCLDNIIMDAENTLCWKFSSVYRKVIRKCFWDSFREAMQAE